MAESRKTILTALVGFGLAMLIWLWAAWDDLLGLGNQSNSYRSQIEEPEKGRLLAPLFYDRGFWAGIATVFIIYTTIGLNSYFPNRCPAFPLGWNLQGAFSGILMGKLPGQITAGRILFVFVGMAFLIPRRIGFSIWFFAVAYGVHEAFYKVYIGRYAWQASQDHNYGAMLAIAASVIWIGRKHWARVAQCTFGKVETPRDRANRFAGRLFLLGVVGLAGWLMWVGVPPWWAMLLVLIAFLVSLVAARIVSETGMPFLRGCADQGFRPLPLLVDIGRDHLFLRHYGYVFPCRVTGQYHRPCHAGAGRRGEDGSRPPDAELGDDVTRSPARVPCIRCDDRAFRLQQLRI